MDAIAQLLQVVDRLLGPNGCPWDQKQTLDSSRTYLLEESAEVIDAINQNDPEAIEEELGDVLFVILFLARIAEKEKKASLKAAAEKVREKLIRRHPHVFDQSKEMTPDEVLHQWQEIKKKEKAHQPPKDPLEKIPKSLPALSRAAEIIKTSKKNDIDFSFIPENSLEGQIGEEIFKLVQKSLDVDVDPELALRRYLSNLVQ